MRDISALRVPLLASLAATALASDITSFTDAKCMRSWRPLDTVNGYPDGLCKPLNVTAGQSFQIQGLDPGCVVTLYGENSGPLSCSSATKIIGHLATCYDSSWVYYSIDGCLPPQASSMKVASVRPTATGLSVTNDAVAVSEPKINTGIVVGSTIGGISCVMLALTGVLLVLRHHRRRKKVAVKPSQELSEDRALAESDADAEKRCPKELWADDAAVEIGRNSRFEDSLSRPEPPQEVHNIRGVNPLIQIRFVP